MKYSVLLTFVSFFSVSSKTFVKEKEVTFKFDFNAIADCINTEKEGHEKNKLLDYLAVWKGLSVGSISVQAVTENEALKKIIKSIDEYQ